MRQLKCEGKTSQHANEAFPGAQLAQLCKVVKHTGTTSNSFHKVDFAVLFDFIGSL